MSLDICFSVLIVNGVYGVVQIVLILDVLTLDADVDAVVLLYMNDVMIVALVPTAINWV